MEEAMEVRSAIQQVALEHRRRYGYRRVSAELRRRGMLVNHKRVARIMREDNLLAVQPKQFVVTTDSNHDLRGLPQLGQSHEAERDQPALGSRHHLHSAASRVRLLGGDPGCLLAQGGGLGAGSDLGQPTGNRSSGAGNQETAASTRGGSSLRSRSAICQRRICGSSREAWHDSEYESASEPYDNASCESFIKTLKREEIYANEYDDLEHLFANLEHFIESVLQSAAVALGARLQLSGRV